METTYGNATYSTHYASHADERCEVVGVVSESTVEVTFEDGTTELVSASCIVRD